MIWDDFKGTERDEAMIRKRVAQLTRDEHGATAVEFGLVAAPFLGIVLAIVQTSMTMMVSQGLDAAVRDAARMVMTGQAVTIGDTTNPDLFRDRYICNPPAPAVRTLPSFIDCDMVLVELRVAPSFDRTSVSSEVRAPTCAGGGRDIVVLRVVYYSPVFAPFLVINGLMAAGSLEAGKVSYGGEQRYALSATAAFRNEPFPGTSPC